MTASPSEPDNIASLRQQLARMQLVVDNVPVQIAYFDSRTLLCVFTNQAYAQANGRTAQWCIGKEARAIIGEAAWQHISPMAQASRAGKQSNYVREKTLPDGTRSYIEVSLIPHFDEQGVQVGSFVLILDITERETNARAVRDSEERLRKFADATGEGIAIHQGGLILDVNEALLRMTGYSNTEYLGHNTLEWIPERLKQQVADYIAAGKEVPYETALLHKDGHEIPVEMVGKTLRYGDQTVRLAVARDLTERKRAEARIAYMAHYDALTDLPNRAHLLERFTEMIAHAQRTHTRMAGLFIDLDHFKTVNDSLGHHAGDELLVTVAGRLRGLLRESDLVARLGGDEFFIVLPDLESNAAAGMVAVKLVEAIGASMLIENTPVSVAPSIGIALYPDDGTDADTLMRNADTAMYRAKDAGRGTFVFYTKVFSDEVTRTLEIANRLREAIHSNTLTLQYQPQLGLRDGRVAGIEALVRWPTSAQAGRAALEPSYFVPLAERQGLIQELGRWAMRHALTQLTIWHDQWRIAGLPLLAIAVNVSARQVKRDGFAQDVLALLGELHLDPSYLEIELTETVLLGEEPNISETLHTLHAAGVKLSVDDFGTGYSSLNYLKRYPISRLKIDRSFVGGLTQQDVAAGVGDAAICRAILGMARALKIEIVAEGVETQEQLACLAEMECDYYQGFLGARPMDAADLAQFVATFTSPQGALL
jgi:diguanylate cyclase (GGDEF)-like protein/PAS domain S-box-containing protein